MRTTRAIDDDLLDKLKAAAAKRGEPLTRIVNETLRRGLAAPRPVRQARFQVEAFDSAFLPGIDPLRLTQALDELDVRRLSEPRRE